MQPYKSRITIMIEPLNEKHPAHRATIPVVTSYEFEPRFEEPGFTSHSLFANPDRLVGADLSMNIERNDQGVAYFVEEIRP